MFSFTRSAGPIVLSLSLVASALGADSQDKYDYLIPQFGEKSLAWVKEQTEATRSKLEASPTFKAVLGDMQKVHATATPLPTYYLFGTNRYLRFVHNQSHPYGRIDVADAASTRVWRTVFDLDAYNETVPQPYTIKWLQPRYERLKVQDFDRCMISLL
jgi:prolyl oligopeptidase PreP (S9A serine peptidase family)